MAVFHEHPKEERETRGRGWRRIDPTPVRVYIANGWHDAVAVDVNDETREVRVDWPPRLGDDPLEIVTHRVLGADHHTLAWDSMRA